MQFLFGDYSLDVGRRELRRGQHLVEVEPQVFDLLVYLVRNRDRVVTRDDIIAAVWGGRIVSESTLSSRITAVRKAIGDSGEQQALIRTAARKGIRFVGEVSERTSVAAAPPGAVSPAPSPAVAPAPRQQVHFCTASDGVRIAYAEVGQGPPLLKTANWLNHLEYDWESPVYGPLLHAIAADHRLIRYDARGNGLSDWDVQDIAFEAFVNDLEAVVEAVGLKRFSLLGLSQGCAVSIAYAVRHPERVHRLVLYGSFARGRKKRDAQEAAGSDALVTLMRQGWGKENPAFRQLFTSLFIPGGTEEQMRWFTDLQRITASPENAARLRQAVDEIDVTDLLPLVKVPTLVLHCRNDAVQPFDEGRRVAAGIPGARFIALEGQNHVPLQGEPAWSRLVEEIRDFLQS
ncbi:MAG TPA: alpha/beta fold hydrolase [Xanthobacteraceae bacterium]|nr:alpha/beta fold hydrolase [Xanthobacteraceae bacterium]